MKKVLWVVVALVLLLSLVVNAGLVEGSNILPTQSLDVPSSAGNWSVVGISHSERDMSGAYRVWVNIIDGANKEWLMFKYKTDPGSAVVLAEAQKQVTVKNSTVAPKTMDQVLAELSYKEATLVALTQKTSDLGITIDQAVSALNSVNAAKNLAEAKTIVTNVLNSLKAAQEIIK